MLAQHTIPCQLSTGFLHLLFIPVLLKTEKYWKQNPIWIEKVWPLLQRTVFLISLSWHDTGVEYDIDLPISWIKFPANKDNWTLRNYSPMLPYRLIKKKKMILLLFQYEMHVCTINRKLLTINMLKRLLSSVWFKINCITLHICNSQT